MDVTVVIPALDEAASIGEVVARVPAGIGPVVVVDNGSRDATAERAREAGAIVVTASQRGYGWACRAGCDAITGGEAVVFLDGDGSMAPEEIPELVKPLLADTADVVCGIRSVSRTTMPWHQRAGNHVISSLLRWHGIHLAELAPFRAIRRSTLDALDLPGSRFAWPAQMLARAARRGARITSVPVGYASRIGGTSKVGGSLRGSLTAAWDISRVLTTERLRR